MEDKQLYGQNQSYEQNQAYNQNQTYGQNQQYNQNQAYGTNQQYDQNQAYGQNQQYDQNQTYNQNPQYGSNPTYGQPYAPQPARAVVYDTMPMKNNNVAIAGLIIGIFSLLGCWVPIWNLVLSIAGIVCSAIGFAHKGSHSKMAIGGLVTSIIALILGIIVMILYFAVIALA